MPDLDPTADDFYDLVVIGRGYSASTYLFTADLSWCKKILIIGGPDAWEKIVRGDGIVNHANYIYARDNPGKPPKPPFKPEDKPAPRTSLTAENKAILETSIKWLTDAKISVSEVHGVTREITKAPAILIKEDITRPTESASLKQGEAVNVYSITYDDWQKPLGDQGFDTKKIEKKTARTLKVVYCGGAGPHKDDFKLDPKRCLDLDSFMRNKSLVAQKIEKKEGEKEEYESLIVIGPNAGVDAAVEALKREFNLFWLISGPEGTKPAWLSTKHYSITNKPDGSIIETANDCVINYDRKKATLTYNKNTNKCVMVFNGAASGKALPEDKRLEVDYVVYATGQDPSAEETFELNGQKYPWRIGPAKVLEPILGNGKEKLTPIYDVNQRFGNWYECALGLRDSAHGPYTGLEVLGASALALANFRGGSKVKQAYFYHTGTSIGALHSKLQPGTNINAALNAIQNSAWNDTANTTRLYDHFDNLGAIPTVASAMTAILPKLYSQTLVAADQLGTIKSQIEAITGFGLISASIPNELIDNASAVLQATAQIKKAIENLSPKPKVDDLGPLKKAIGDYKTASGAFGEVDNSVNEAATEYIKLLPKDEFDILQKEGFQANRFASEINSAMRKLSWQVNFISADTPHVGDDWRYLETYNQQDILKNIPAVQRQLTNLRTIFEAAATGKIQSVINFNSMDRSQLAVLLSAAYTSIPVTNWRPITEKIQEGRKVSPWGYDEDQVKAIEAWLKAMNEGKKSVNEFPSMS